MYIQPAKECPDEASRIGKLEPEAAYALEAEIRAFFALHPAWLTQVNKHETLLQYLCKGIWHGWCALNAEGDMEVFGICAWEAHDHDAIYHILYIGGTNLQHHLAAGLKELERFVYLNGGSSLSFHGRPGWHRRLRAYGYTPVTHLRKNVRKTMGH